MVHLEEASALKKQLDLTVQQKLGLEDRITHLDGALKECMRQLREFFIGTFIGVIPAGIVAVKVVLFLVLLPVLWKRQADSKQSRYCEDNMTLPNFAAL